MDCRLQPGSSVHGILRQEYWRGLPSPLSGDLLNPRIKPVSLTSPALAGRFFFLALMPSAKPMTAEVIPNPLFQGLFMSGQFLIYWDDRCEILMCQFGSNRWFCHVISHSGVSVLEAGSGTSNSPLLLSMQWMPPNSGWHTLCLVNDSEV